MTSSYRERPSAVPGATAWQADPVGATRVLPDGCMDLVWRTDHLVVAGPDTTAHVHTARPGSAAHGLRFSAGTLPALLGVPACELLDQRVALEDLGAGPFAAVVADRLVSCDDPCRGLERAVLDHFGPPSVPTFASAVLDGLGRGETAARLADELGYGERQLLRRCRACFGYGPSRLRRILRLQRVLERSGTLTGGSLATIAAEAGYADQSHLHRDVLELTGVTPTMLRAELAGVS